MRFRVVVVLAALLLLALLPASFAAAASPQAAASHSRAHVLAYWTPARLQAARPRDFAFDSVRGFHPDAKPGGGGGGGGTVTGASWPASASDPITRATGRVVFSMGGGDWICSGSVATDTRSGFSTVLTAGHCVVDSDTGEFATNWMFIPAFDLAPTYTCANATYGCWTATALVARREFATAGAFNDTAVTHDWGFAVVAGGGKQANSTSQLDTTVGGTFALDATTAAAGATLTALGYPAAGRYRGKDLTCCQGPVGRDAQTDNLTYGLACNMTGASSGGPWLSSASAGYGAKLRSLNSYGYSGVKNMYGPIFNSETTATYTTATGTTSGDVLVP
jgi:V8-like Glu-specific endopeptidase